MLKNVEGVNDEDIEGYYFEDEDGDEFQVILVAGPIASVVCKDFCEMMMYKKDIPRFIKVLEAAYNHKESL